VARALERTGAQHSATLEAFARGLEQLERHALGPDDLGRAVAELPDEDAAARERLLLLADVAREAALGLGRHGMASAAGAECRIAAALDALGPDAALPWPLAATGS